MLSARAFALACALSLLVFEASAVTGMGEWHWRRRAGVPPRPYPELLYPEEAPSLPSGFTMTITRHADDRRDDAAKIEHPRDVATRLAACWSSPDVESGAIEVTVRFQLSRSGSIVGQPRVSYVKTDRPKQDRERVASSILDAIKACTPMQFTGSLGAAIAGYPFAIRFIAPARDQGQEIH